MSATLAGYLAERDAASVLGWSPLTLARKRRNGEGPPYIRVGQHLLYKVSDLEAWLDKQRVDPEGAA